MKIQNEVKLPLHLAVSRGNLHEVSSLIKKKADINKLDGASTPLSLAACSGHLELIKLLLEKKAEVNQVIVHNGSRIGSIVTQVIFSKQEFTEKKAMIALLFTHGAHLGMEELVGALKSEQYPIAEYLITLNTHIVNSKDNERTALHLFIEDEKNPYEKAKWLLEHKADPLIKNHGIRPIDVVLAKKSPSLPLVELLVNSSQELSISAQTLIMSAREGNLPSVKYCLRGGIPVDAENYHGITPLIAASIQSQNKIVQHLLTSHANVNYITTMGFTPLLSAIQADNREGVEILLSKKANVNYQGEDQLSALHLVAKLSLSQIATSLTNFQNMGNFLDVNLLSSEGETALGYAVTGTHEKTFFTVKKLLKLSGINVDNPNKLGNTPLISAVMNGQDSKIVSLLIDSHAQVNYKNLLGMSAFALAIKKNHLKLAKLLLEEKADPGSADNGDKTPLMSAASAGFIEMVSLLLAHHQDPDKRNTHGLSARKCAEDAKKKDVLAVFSQYDSKKIILKIFPTPTRPEAAFTDFLEHEGMTISMVTPESFCISAKRNFHNKNLILSKGELSRLCLKLDLDAIGKSYKKLVTQINIDRKKNPPLARQTQTTPLCPVLMNLKSSIDKDILNLNAKKALLLVQLKQSNKNINSEEFSESKKKKTHQERNAQRQEQLDSLLNKLTEKFSDLSKRCVAGFASNEDQLAALDFAKALNQEIVDATQHLCSMKMLLEAQLLFEENFQNAYIKDPKIPSTPIPKAPKAQKRKKRAKKIKLSNKNEMKQNDDDKALLTPSSTSPPLGPLPSSPLRPSLGEQERKKNSPISPVHESLYHYSRPVAATLGHTQISQAMQASAILYNLRIMVSQIVNYEDASLPAGLIRNALLGISAQYMEALKHVNNSLNPFTAEEAKHFRDVVYHAPELFIDSKQEDGGESKDISPIENRLMEMILKLLDFSSSKKLKLRQSKDVITIDSPLYIQIQTHQIRVPTYSFCHEQILTSKQELKDYRSFVRSISVVCPFANFAINFCIARLGVYAAVVRDNYSQNDIYRLFNQSKKYLSKGAEIRHLDGEGHISSGGLLTSHSTSK